MSLRILTLNTWGSPYAKHHAPRRAAIAGRLLALAPDVIALQEVFRKPDRQLLQRELRAEYPHQHYFASGLLGSGLLTLSRHPIVDAAFYRFRLGGESENIQRGDYYGGKGIGLTSIQTPEDGLINVFNSHTHAQYDPAEDNRFAIFTDSNLYEAARFIQGYSTAPVILCGDLNTRPGQGGYRIITALGHLTDAYTALHPNDAGTTYDPDNPYSDTSIPERLDYILLRGLRVQNIKITLTERLSDAGPALAYSDHYGLLAEVTPATTDTAHEAANNACDVLSNLHTRLQAARTEMDVARSRYAQRGVFGIAAMVDLLLSGGLRKRLGWFYPLLLLATGGYGAAHLLHNALNLRPRATVIDAQLAEISHQLAAQRLFDGRHCE